MLSKYQIVVLSIGLFVINLAHAVEPNEIQRKDTINLYDAVSRSNAHHPALEALNFELSAQRADAELAGLRKSPNVTFEIEDVAGTGNHKNLDAAQATLGIAWLVEGSIRQGHQSFANAKTHSVLAEINVKKLDIASETARLYLYCLANQTRLKMTEQSVLLANKTVKEIKKRLRAGKTADVELARAQAEVARRKLDAEDVEHELMSSYRLLAAQWGETKPGFSRVSGDLFTLSRPIAFDVLEQRMNDNPEFIRLFSERNVKQAELELEKSKSSAPWEVKFGVRHYEASQDQALVAGISIPFGERSRNKAGIVRAQERVSELDAREKALQVKFKTELYVLYQEYLHSLHRMNAYRDEIIPKLELALKKTRRAYQLGRYSFLEWQSVQSDLFEAQADLLESSVDAHLKMIQIERLTGVQITPSNIDMKF